MGATNDPVQAVKQARLDAIARQFDAWHVGTSTHLWRTENSTVPVVEYVRRINPDIQTWAYIPGGFYWRLPLFSCLNHPYTCGAQALIKDSDWMRKPSGSYVVIGSEANTFLNPLTGIQSKLGAYWAGWLAESGIDGVHWDLNETTLSRDGGHVDLNLNSISDIWEFGLRWLDAQYVAGHLQRLAEFEGAGLHVGNGAWQPGQEAYYDALDGGFVELAMSWRDPADGRWKPAKQDVLRWQVDLIQQWKEHNPDAVMMILPKPERLQDDYWKQYWSDQTDIDRIGLGMALLTDSQLVLLAPTMPRWCDECGVVNGTTSTARGAGDWLGCPLEDAQCDGDVCSRQFQNGAVYVNLSASTVALPAPAGLRAIRGWYNQVVNNGAAWDGVLPPHSARILWRTAAPAPTPTAISTRTPVPTNTPSPSPTTAPTSTPTRTPTTTPSPTVDVQQLQERIEALETRVFGQE